MVWIVYHKSDQLIEFAAIAFAAVTTKDITRSYEICGFTKDTDKHKWVQIAYDPTGNSLVRREKNRASPTNLEKKWICPICDHHHATI